MAAGSHLGFINILWSTFFSDSTHPKECLCQFWRLYHNVNDSPLNGLLFAPLITMTVQGQADLLRQLMNVEVPAAQLADPDVKGQRTLFYSVL